MIMMMTYDYDDEYDDDNDDDDCDDNDDDYDFSTMMLIPVSASYPLKKTDAKSNLYHDTLKVMKIPSKITANLASYLTNTIEAIIPSAPKIEKIIEANDKQVRSK